MSNQTEIIAPTQAGQATHQLIDASNRLHIHVSASNLQTTEEVLIFGRSGGNWVPIPNKELDGGDAKLTATIRWLTLLGGLEYAVTLGTTAADCGVYVNYGPHRLDG